MSEPTRTTTTEPGPGPGAGAPTDPGDRGDLTFTPRAVERLATRAAAEVDGVVGVESGLTRLTASRYPQARALLAGDHARVDVDVAVAWPRSLPDVEGRVRTSVAQELRRLTGLQVDAVNVTAAAVVRPGAETPSRVS